MRTTSALKNSPATRPARAPGLPGRLDGRDTVETSPKVAGNETSVEEARHEMSDDRSFLITRAELAPRSVAWRPTSRVRSAEPTRGDIW